MTVLITWFATSSGGGERSTIELCNRLSASGRVGHVILLYAHSDSEAHRLVRTRLSAEVQLYVPRMPLRVWRLVGFLWVLYICSTQHPSLVQVNIRAAFIESLAAKLCGCRVISVLRIMPFHPRQLWDYKFVDHMICVSNAVRDKVRSLGWAKDVTVIYNGVEVSLFTPTDRRYEGEANCFYTFGRLVDWKRHDFFVRAAALVRRIDPSAKFLIFGEGKEKSFLEKLIETYHLSSAVRLMGSVEPTDKLLDQCGIFVFTSYEEAFGRVLVEAVLKGKVVVASRSGAVPELLQDHPLLFARDRVDALASQMLRASANFEKYRIEAAEMRVRFAHQFNLDRVAADYLNLYSRMVS